MGLIVISAMVYLMILLLILCTVTERCNSWKSFTVVLSIWVILGIGMGFWLKAKYNNMPECDKHGHEYITKDYYNVFEETMELEQIVTDSHYEGKIEGNLETSSFFIWHSTSTNTEGSLEQREEYKYYYKTADGGYKKTSIPVENTTVYYITDGEPYVEVWRQYGNYTVCSVCGERAGYDWTCNFYKLYVPQGSIAEEISIQ